MITRERILLETRLWRTEKENLDKDYFKNLTNRNKPAIMWIESFGNVASVPELTNIEPDEITVYRNMGGQCKSDDLSFMAAVESFVSSRDAKYIIVCGHNHCPAIRDVISGNERGAYAARWMEDIYDLYEQRATELAGLTPSHQERRLSQLNVRQQLLNLSTLDIVQRAWSGGRNLSLLGWYLDLSKGGIEEVYSMANRDMLTESATRH